MSLPEKLNAARTADARRSRPQHPKGYEPGVKFEAGQLTEAVVQLPPGSEITEDEARWREEITRVTNMPVPEHRRVELSQVRYWGDKHEPYIYCRFTITDRPEALEAGEDFVEVLRRLRSTRDQRKLAKNRGPAAFVLSWNDWQLGKAEGGGSESTVSGLLDVFAGAIDRVKELRKVGRELGRLVVVGGGDMVEGCDMFANHSWQVDLDRRAQVRATVGMILEGLDLLAPLFTEVTVLAVGGNHGENRLGHVRTTQHDNDDVAVFEHAAAALSRDRSMRHVNFVLADDEAAKTIDVCGWVLGTTHGHVYGKTSTGSVEQKALKWYQAQAGAKAPIGDSDILLTHHYHHFAARDWGGAMWLQSPAMDGGSRWYQDQSGFYAPPGMLSFVVTPDTRVQDIQVLTPTERS